MDAGLCRCGGRIELVILKDGDLIPDIRATTSVSECLNEAAPRFPCPLALLKCITYLHERIGTIFRLARRFVELLEGKQSDVDLFHHPMVLDGDGKAQRPDAFAAP